MAKKIVNKVLDLSSFQGILTSEAVELIKASGYWVILRLGYTGYGSNKPALDAAFEANYNKLKAAGIPVGAYYFTIAFSESMARLEAEFIINRLSGKKLELPIYIDVEAQNNSVGWSSLRGGARATYVKIVCSMLEQAKYYVGIYASKSWLTNNNVLDMKQLTAYDVWVAQYNPVCTYNGNYGLWQYSSKESAAKYGIEKTKNVDINNAYYDFPSIIKAKGLNGYAERKGIICPHCGTVIEVD